MTREIRKEEFSLNLFSALAAKSGFKSIRPNVDDGIDLLINPSKKLIVKDIAQGAVAI